MAALGTDTFADNGSNTRFVFSHGVGAATIAGFEAGGGGRDSVVLPSSDASRIGQILTHAQDDGLGNTTLHLGRGDTITFDGIAAADLEAHPGVFRFRA